MIFINRIALNQEELLRALHVGTISFKTQVVCIKGNPQVNPVSDILYLVFSYIAHEDPIVVLAKK